MGGLLDIDSSQQIQAAHCLTRDACRCFPPACREVHEQCRESLESGGYLQSLLALALASAREAAPAAPSGADGGVCLAALRLLSAICAWSFSRGGCADSDMLADRMLQCTRLPHHGPTHQLHAYSLPVRNVAHPTAARGSGVWHLMDSGRPAADAAPFRPPAAWRDALLAPDAWAWLAALSQTAWCVWLPG